MSEFTDDLWSRMARELAANVEHLVTARVEASLDRFYRTEAKAVFSETEAAKFLGVSKDTLQHWRKRNIITYAQYPQAKTDDLSDMYTYSLADLMNFRERYLRKAAGSPNVFEMAREILAMGPEVKRKAA
jgi:hypothetical protein